MAKNNDYDTNSINTIGAGTIVKGDITSDGEIWAHGKVNRSSVCEAFRKAAEE